MKFCKKCQIETERNASSKCKPCVSACSAAWAKANPERVKTNNDAWYAANTERVKSQGEDWRAANPDREKARRAAWREANPELNKARTVAWNAANPERVKANNAAWNKANPDKVRVKGSNRRARKLRAEGKHTAEDIQRLLQLQKGVCVVCRADISQGYHVDHILPLVREGKNDWHNLQLLCPTCNRQKGAKHPIDFIQQKGFLL